jgi:N-methylhydantoinase A
LNYELAYRSIAQLARRHGFQTEELALGVIEIVNNHMEQAIKKVSIERGLDPQDFTLVCFGGAGGLHATALAERLSIKEILIPRLSGVLSALGFLMARPSFDFSRTVFLVGDQVAYEYLLPLIEELVQEAFRELQRYGYQIRDFDIKAEIDLRYQGQSYELTVAFEPNLRENFHALHQRLYEYALPLAVLEVTAIRATLEAPAPEISLPQIQGKELGPREEAEVIFEDGKGRKCPVYLWEELPPEAEIKGPALLAGPYATIWVAPLWQVQTDLYGNLWLSSD